MDPQFGFANFVALIGMCVDLILEVGAELKLSVEGLPSTTLLGFILGRFWSNGQGIFLTFHPNFESCMEGWSQTSVWILTSTLPGRTNLLCRGFEAWAQSVSSQWSC